ncbi:MAG: hypothetical protein ACHQDY_08505 [Solirubrobacterales bacterium]
MSLDSVQREAETDVEQMVHEEEMPGVQFTRRRVIAGALFVLSAIGFFYFVLPKISSVGTTVHGIEGAERWWIAAGVILEALSFAAYVVLFQAVFVDRDPPAPHSRIGWRESYLITMTSVVATRLFATAGAGGVALTAWALRRSGMEARLVACRMVAFLVLLYVIYAVSLVLAGVGLGTGLFPGGGSFAITIVPAIVGGLLLVVGGAVTLLPPRHRAPPCALGGRLGAPRALDGAPGDGAGACGQRGADRDRARAHARSAPAGGARVVGL